MSRLQLGIRGHDMPKAPFEELVKSISEAGFCCTQLALAKAITEFNVSSEAMTSGMATYMKRVFEKNKVEVSVLGCYKNLANPDSLHRLWIPISIISVLLLFWSAVWLVRKQVR